MKEEPFFEIGLCMAGAVSAGAYTAGLMDYLIETPDKWGMPVIVPKQPAPFRWVGHQASKP